MQVQKRLQALVLWTLATSVMAEEAADTGDVNLTGPNVCIDQREETNTVNVTYLESHNVREYEWCANIPPRCPVWRTVMSTKYKPKVISRIVNHHRCCTGYQQVDNRCEPVCSQTCVRGECVEPETCACEAGFSGDDCSQPGCPNRNWGPGCSNPCPCVNEGSCDPKTGACKCPPGFRGQNCEQTCDADHFGHNCEKECDCEVGQRCQHVTGDCSPCPAGTFGLKCAGACSCSANGTELCYHTNGNCFCKSNHYGRRCEMHCPFGYLNGVCHVTPMEVGFCSCSSDLYRCDEEKGCVCKDGFDCKGGTHFIDFAPLSSAEGDPASHAQAVSIVASVLFFVLIVAVLAVVFYRRRLRRAQKDLEHRSVRYIENSVVNTSNPGNGRGGNNEIVVTSADPVYDEPLDNNLVVALPNNNGSNNSNNASVYNNAVAGPSRANYEKNVNIDRFKLGEEEAAANHRYEEMDEDEDDHESQAMSVKQRQMEAEERYGACALAAACTDESNDDEEAEILPDHPKVKAYVDINVFQDDGVTSPSKEKNNEKLADLLRKVNKPNVNAVINNTFESNGNETRGAEAKEEEDIFDDMDPKTFVTLERDDFNRFEDDFAGK